MPAQIIPTIGAIYDGRNPNVASKKKDKKINNFSSVREKYPNNLDAKYKVSGIIKLIHKTNKKRSVISIRRMTKNSGALPKIL